jgi:hypothetical protein
LHRKYKSADGCHGSTPLTMTFTALASALTDLLERPLAICRSQVFSTVLFNTLYYIPSSEFFSSI